MEPGGRKIEISLQLAQVADRLVSIQTTAFLVSHYNLRDFGIEVVGLKETKSSAVPVTCRRGC